MEKLHLMAGSVISCDIIWLLSEMRECVFIVREHD